MRKLRYSLYGPFRSVSMFTDIQLTVFDASKTNQDVFCVYYYIPELNILNKYIEQHNKRNILKTHNYIINTHTPRTMFTLIVGTVSFAYRHTF